MEARSGSVRMEESGVASRPLPHGAAGGGILVHSNARDLEPTIPSQHSTSKQEAMTGEAMPPRRAVGSSLFDYRKEVSEV
jgi:hypothetical protein